KDAIAMPLEPSRRQSLAAPAKRFLQANQQSAQACKHGMKLLSVPQQRNRHRAAKHFIHFVMNTLLEHRADVSLALFVLPADGQIVDERSLHIVETAGWRLIDCSDVPPHDAAS